MPKGKEILKTKITVTDVSHHSYHTAQTISSFSLLFCGTRNSTTVTMLHYTAKGILVT